LKTAQTLLRAAQTMTDRAIAGQLKALADDYQQRSEEASHVDAPKRWRTPSLNTGFGDLENLEVKISTEKVRATYP
jgi:hypothetical protein